jgi:hypothetical protein
VSSVVLLCCAAQRCRAVTLAPALQVRLRHLGVVGGAALLRGAALPGCDTIRGVRMGRQ